LAVSRPTSVAFGGADLGTLFITSMHHGMTAEERAREPLAGALFQTRPGIAGLPEPLFAG
jgi:L-arabinonolactonase